MKPVLEFITQHLTWPTAMPKRTRRKIARLKDIAARLARIERMPADVTATGPYILMGTFRSTIGLGHSARRLALSLTRAGHQVYTIDVTEIFGLATVVPWTENPPPPDSPGTLVLCIQPPTLHRILRARGTRDFAGRRWVGYWWWELERLPESWQWVAAEMDEFWCSSRFVYDCFARSVPQKPSVYVPLVIELPVASEKRLSDFGLQDDCFTVLSIFDLRSYSARKNPDGMIAAFKQAFATRQDVHLVLKVGGGEKFPAELARLRDLATAAGNIRIISENLATADIFALIKKADVFLSLHRSEGLGMVPAEAALLGTPIVTTGWSGVLDFLDRSCAALVNYRLVSVLELDNLPAPAGSLWAEPDIAHAAYWLTRLETDRELRGTLAQRASDLASRVFSQTAFNEAFRQADAASATRNLIRT